LPDAVAFLLALSPSVFSYFFLLSVGPGLAQLVSVAFFLAPFRATLHAFRALSLLVDSRLQVTYMRELLAALVLPTPLDHSLMVAFASIPRLWFRNHTDLLLP